MFTVCKLTIEDRQGDGPHESTHMQWVGYMPGLAQPGDIFRFGDNLRSLHVDHVYWDHCEYGNRFSMIHTVVMEECEIYDHATFTLQELVDALVKWGWRIIEEEP